MRWYQVVLALLILAAPAWAQAPAMPPLHDPNDYPNPYHVEEGWAKLGRPFGGVSAVDMDPDGNSVWVFERCGAESCADSTLPPILHFDPSGKLLASFGAGMFVFPHGLL